MRFPFPPCRLRLRKARSQRVTVPNDQQRAEAAAFEEGKDALSGLHFLSVQVSDDDEEPAGFWLLRDLPRGI